jgi:tRNA(fMet)-specific endonuclease VapC
MYLLDTSILSELIKRHPHHGLLARLRQYPPAALFTSAICVMELRYGASLRADRDAFWRKIQEEILAHVQVIECGEREAMVAGDLLAHLKRMGRPVGLEDALIGATARARGLIVVTHNLRHFETLPEIRVEDWLSS